MRSTPSARWLTSWAFRSPRFSARLPPVLLRPDLPRGVGRSRLVSANPASRYTWPADRAELARVRHAVRRRRGIQYPGRCRRGGPRVVGCAVRGHRGATGRTTSTCWSSAISRAATAERARAAPRAPGQSRPVLAGAMAYGSGPSHPTGHALPTRLRCRSYKAAWSGCPMVRRSSIVVG